jgi:hypothetical protein
LLVTKPESVPKAPRRRAATRPAWRLLAATLLAAACNGASGPETTPDPGPGPGPGPDTTPTIPGPATVQLDTTRRFQTMTGWEGTAQAGHSGPTYPLYRDTLMTLLAGDLGINRLRLEIRSGSEHRRDYFQEIAAGRLTGNAARCARYETQNDDADPRHIDWTGFRFTEFDETVEKVVLPLKRALEQRGKRLSLAVTYVSFMPQCPASARYDHAAPAEYAEFVRATVLHLRDRYGLVPDLWEMILEPDNTTVWGGRYIGTAMVAAAEALRQDGITMRFVAPSNTSMSAAVSYYDEMLSVAGAKPLVAELAYHRYRGVSDATLREIANRSQRDAVATSMLEHIGSGVDDLLDDILLGNASAWQQFVLTFDAPNSTDTGGSYYLMDFSDPSRPIPREGQRTRYLRQVFTAAPLGAVRVAATSADARARPVAFRAPNGKLGIAIRTAEGMAFSVGGLARGRYAVTFATESVARGQGAELDVGANGWASLAIPAAGVVTLIQR